MKIKLFQILLLLIVAFNAKAQTDPASIITPIIYQPHDFQLSDVTLSTETIEFLANRIGRYDAYNFDYDSLNNYMLSNLYALEFNLISPSDTTLLILQRRDMRSANFVQTETDSTNTILTIFERNNLSDTTFIVRTFNGFADRNFHVISRFAIYENSLRGYIFNTDSNQVLYYISLQEFILESGLNYSTTENPLLIFNLKDLISDTNVTCGVIDEELPDNDDYRGFFEECTPRYLEIAVEGDFWWCQKYGSEASNKILENLFFVEGIYTHNFNISFVINHISLLNNNSNLYNTTNAITKLNEFRSYWNSNHTSIPRDVAILYTALVYSGTTRGNTFLNQMCNIQSSYATIQSHPSNIFITTHELGHLFGSSHDDGDDGYGTSNCDGNDYPVMCEHVGGSGQFQYFSPFTREVILTTINNKAGCLNDYSNGDQLSKTHKTWSNHRDQRWIASWFQRVDDYKVAGNFDGDPEGDEEIFFASPDRNWVGIVDFSCDNGTDWYHLWGNGGNRSFGYWYRNYDDYYLAGDFDGDGKDEVLSVSGNRKWFAIQEYNPSSWSWTLKYGNSGTQQVAYWIFGSMDSYVVADFDGDGKDELLCINPNGWAQILKFNWNSAGYYVPQTIWSNNGNGWVGGVTITGTDQWLTGKFTNSTNDELLTISGTWVSTQKFNGSGWDWIWSQYGANNFASMYILPLNSDQHILTGNFDSDDKDEFININNTWFATADYDGNTFVQNFNNAGNETLHDWELKYKNQYLSVKASPTASKQIFATRIETTQNFLWVKTDAPTLSSMYKCNGTNYNFRPDNTDTKDEETMFTGKLKVYPNPAAKSITIQFDSVYTKANCTIFDVSGKIVKTTKVSSENPVIELNDLIAGIYFLSITFDNSQLFTTKITIYEH